MDNAPDEVPSPADRRTVIRDVVVLQLKLVVDGLRDVVLVPASLIAGLLSIVSSHDGRPGNQFYRLLAFGKRSERYINLFGALANAPADVAPPANADDADIDQVVSRLEAYLVDEYRHGGLTAQAKERVDRLREAIAERKSKPKA